MFKIDYLRSRSPSRVTVVVRKLSLLENRHGREADMPPATINFDDLSVSGIEYVLESAIASPDIIRTVFGKLLQPDQDEDFIQNYCVRDLSVLSVYSTYPRAVS
jgi:hypothetical protein